MNAIEINCNWITGVMAGLEFVSSSDFEEEYGVRWGVAIDLFIIRFVFLWRKI